MAVFEKKKLSLLERQLFISPSYCAGQQHHWTQPVVSTSRAHNL